MSEHGQGQNAADARHLVAELARLRDRLSTIVDEAFGLRPVSSFDELLDILEREQSAERIQLVNQRTELERELATVRASLSRAGAWLAKDFWLLYQAADATLRSVTLGEADTRAWLELQLARLRPAFDVCESERHGSRDRLTPAEQSALRGLHRWLHSPGGDGTLIEDAEFYHGQVAGESPAECERLEAEERGIDALGDAGVLASDIGERMDGISRALFERVGQILGTPKDSPSAHGCSAADDPPAAVAAAIVRTILDDERVSGPNSDTDAGAMFLAHALLGARMGWHARTVHPTEIDRVAELGAPSDEPKRTAWRFGFDLATKATPDESERPTEPELETPVVVINPNDPAPLWEQAERPAQLVPANQIPRAVLERFGRGLTAEQREYAKEHLRYRAPELLTARDRAILAAYDAEETARAKSPDTWLGGDR